MQHPLRDVITGYRYPGRSVQHATGVIPDLTCLGKALASGMPLAAVRAAIGIYRREPVADHIWTIGSRLKAGIDAMCRELGVPGSCKGPPFRFSLAFDEPDPPRRRLARTLYMQELLGAGLVTVSGVMLPSFAHSDEVVEDTLRRLRGVLAVLAEAWRLRDFDLRIDIPLL